MMVANLTRFLCQSPELFSLIPGRLGRCAVFFRRPMDLGMVTIVIHEITCRQRNRQCRTRDVLNRTIETFVRWS
jgi:hypothetical protein